MTDVERYRLVLLGAGQVGKTCIINRFLHHKFCDRYKETCEDIHSRDFRIKGRILPLDIVDTNFGYPDMRRLSMISAHAFVIVFSVDDVSSFKHASDLLEEVCCRRSDAKSLPLVIVGNKSDLDNKKINEGTALAFVNRVVGTRIDSVKYLETSAKTGDNITAIFKHLLDASGFCKDHALVTETQSNDTLLPGGVIHKRTASFRHNRSTPKQEADDTDNEQSSRLSRTFSRKDKDKGGNEKLTRHGSLMRKTNRFSLKHKQAPINEPDESDCIIS